MLESSEVHRCGPAAEKLWSLKCVRDVVRAHLTSVLVGKYRPTAHVNRYGMEDEVFHWRQWIEGIDVHQLRLTVKTGCRMCWWCTPMVCMYWLCISAAGWCRCAGGVLLYVPVV